MPPRRRNWRHAAPAAANACAPLCITPQMSTIQASHAKASSAIEDRIGMTAGVMRSHLDEIPFGWKWCSSSSRRGRCDHLVLQQPRPTEQRAFAKQHAEAQNARQQPVIIDAADDQSKTKACQMPADVGGGRAATGGGQSVEEHGRIELDEGKAHAVEGGEIHVEVNHLLE